MGAENPTEGRQEALESNTDPGKAGAMANLDSILGDYEARTRTKAEENRRREQAEQAARDKAQRLLGSVALPVLQDIAAAVAAKGHHCEAQEHRGGTYPAVSLNFQPVGLRGDVPLHFVSMLFVAADDGGMVKVSKTVRRLLGSESSHSESRLPLADLSEAKVRAEAESFIQAVVAAN